MAYSFDRYCRDFQLTGKVLRPFTVSGLIDRNEGSDETMADTLRTIEAVRAAMLPDERAAPLKTLEFRRMEIADAAGISDGQLCCLFRGYEIMAKRPDRELKPWQKVFVLMAVWACLPFLSLVTAGRFLLQKMRLLN